LRGGHVNSASGGEEAATLQQFTPTFPPGACRELKAHLMACSNKKLLFLGNIKCTTLRKRYTILPIWGGYVHLFWKKVHI